MYQFKLSFSLLNLLKNNKSPIFIFYLLLKINRKNNKNQQLDIFYFKKI